MTLKEYCTYKESDEDDELYSEDYCEEFLDAARNAAWGIQEGVIEWFSENGLLEAVLENAEMDEITDMIDGDTVAYMDYDVMDLVMASYGDWTVARVYKEYSKNVLDKIKEMGANNRKIRSREKAILDEYKNRGEAIDYQGPIHFTKGDKDALKALRKKYKTEGIKALFAADKITFSNALSSEFSINTREMAEKELGIKYIRWIELSYDFKFTGFDNACWDSLEKNAEKETLAFIEENEKKEKKKRQKAFAGEEIQKMMPESYADLFPRARGMKRHFFIHVGPTNSGKTHAAIEAPSNAEKGMYLAPLRLLAYEQYEKMNDNDVPCTLLTGEEYIKEEGARVVSSTIEMVDLSSVHDVVVIDEAQMISDLDRGGAWSNAILGVLSEEIHVCCAPEAEKIIKRIVEECGDTCEIVKHERMTNLIVGSTKPYKFTSSVKKGDALIVFSRITVHAVASELQGRGIKCSIIYGALPYDVRHKEARKFAEGITDVVVSTDAIGMGMNLPIKRVVFLETSKYDGHESRTLLPQEVKQIGGRAGRFGIYDTGYVEAFGSQKLIEKLYNTSVPNIKKAVIQFPESLLQIDAPLLTTLIEWKKLDAANGWVKADAERMIELANAMRNYNAEKRFLYDFISIAFDHKNDRMLKIWKRMFLAELSNDKTYDPLDDLPHKDPQKIGYFYGRPLADLEEDHKVCDLIYTYFRKFHPNDQEAMDTVSNVRSHISKEIMKQLSESKLLPRKCNQCGRKLSWNYPYGICQKCYNRNREYRYDYYDFW